MMDPDFDDDHMLLGPGSKAPREPSPAAQGDDVNDAGGDVDADALLAQMSDTGSDSDDDGAEAAPGATATDGNADAGTAGGEEGDDSAARIAGITSKKEAKLLLSKKEYKKWKKQNGKSKKDKSKKDKQAKAGKKSSKGAEKKSAGGDKKQKSGRRKKYRTASDDEGDDAVQSAGHVSDDDEEGGGRRKRRSRKAPVENTDAQYDYSAGATARQPLQPRQTRQPGGRKETEGARMARVREEAERIVERLNIARLRDFDALRNGTGAPINRIQLIPMVKYVANRLDLHEHLVEAGFLKEICNWLCTGHVLAPIDLRTAALEALNNIKFENSEGGKLPSAATNSKKDEEDTYQGATKEQLIETNLGFAVNLLRTHPEETTANKAKATYLLQRLSRAFDGERDDRRRETKKWQTQGDQHVLPPFEIMKSASEVFADKTSRINPLDPNSYLRVPPLRLPATYISGMFEYQGTQKDRDEGDH
jgi:hypothetical protein